MMSDGLPGLHVQSTDRIEAGHGGFAHLTEAGIQERAFRLPAR
ncbi:hypothetical protein Deipe_1053 [Deinococcus peraridilitoris DSM 19664]|uniref:Uncharacterized protein n=1 Tax=Deinococcus peraridilitoris (strain DSM 19664 / LMG 22246 / CIP 109416 / KR-200) TaxID=937777 RepID=K9ZYH1_DEIPD|nr:hypothetical protein Deipe_1053 [Deinococcus peraridilitoris DSM 19664]